MPSEATNVSLELSELTEVLKATKDDVLESQSKLSDRRMAQAAWQRDHDIRLEAIQRQTTRLLTDSPPEQLRPPRYFEIEQSTDLILQSVQQVRDEILSALSACREDKRRAEADKHHRLLDAIHSLRSQSGAV